MLVILFNCIAILIDNSSLTGGAGNTTPILVQLDTFFFVFYITELSLKVTALGFFMNEGAYLTDGWNVLDFFIISTAIINKIIYEYGINFKSLRSLRVLRPLKVIATLKQLQTILESLFLALPLLADAFLILLFCYLLYALAGLQLFPGLLKKRCIYTNTGISTTALCGNLLCDNGQICSKLLNNPNYGLMNFDNIFFSFLNVFQIVTVDNWTSIMYSVQKTFTNYTSIYFLTLMIIGGLFLVNLTLAVIKVKFSELNNKTPTIKKTTKMKQIYDFHLLKSKNIWRNKALSLEKAERLSLINNPSKISAKLPSVNTKKSKSNPFSMRILLNLRDEFSKLTVGIKDLTLGLTSYANELGKATINLGKTVGMGKLIKVMDKLSPIRLLRKSQGVEEEEIVKRPTIEALNMKYLKLQISNMKEYQSDGLEDIYGSGEDNIISRRKVMYSKSTMCKTKRRTKGNRIIRYKKKINGLIYKMPKNIKKERVICKTMRLPLCNNSALNLKKMFISCKNTQIHNIFISLTQTNNQVNFVPHPKNFKIKPFMGRLAKTASHHTVIISGMKIEYEDSKRMIKENLEDESSIALREIWQNQLFNNTEIYKILKVFIDIFIFI